MDEGTTTDYDSETKALTSPFTRRAFQHSVERTHRNLIDTQDTSISTAEVERSLRVLDEAVVVFDGQKGVEELNPRLYGKPTSMAFPGWCS